MLEAGVLTAIGIIWILSRFNLKRIAGYATFWDITITGVVAWLFVGTYAGMMTGMLAGICVSAFLTVIGRVAGKERLRLVRHKDEVIARPRWRSVR
jgi:hypothetical protein